MIVTGAVTGIGRAVAERFARAGASLLLIDVDREGAHALAQALERDGSAAEAVVGDVADENTARSAVERAEARFGGIHTLVNNACGARNLPALELGAAEWRRTLDVCLTGTFLLVHHALPVMVRGGGGVIVNVSSVNAARGTPGMPAYAAAKGGVSALTRHLAVEYGRFGIRTNAIAPGLIATDELNRGALSDSAEARAAAEGCPLRRPGRPDEVASVALFLASDDASYLNGQVLTVDGGTSVQWPMVLVRPTLRGMAGLPRITWMDEGE